jgi:hypothetical protein
MFVIGLVYRRCTISSGGGQFKAAQHSGYSMDMTALSYICMRIGSKNQGKSFENLCFVQERSMCKVIESEK